MRDYLKRLDRLEDSAPAGGIGLVMRIFWTGDKDEEPCAATCEGVRLSRTAGETQDEFMARVREAFPEIPGKIRSVFIDQSRPPFPGEARY